MSKEVIQRGAEGVGCAAFCQEIVVLCDRDCFESFVERQGFCEMFIDLGKDARQVPGEDVVAGRFAGLCALGEAPAVLDRYPQ